MNAWEELEFLFQEENIDIDKLKLIKAVIKYRPYNEGDNQPWYKTTDLYDLKHILKSIDYDNGFGIQCLFGEIDFLYEEEPLWLTRQEYDGSEWWEINRLPAVYGKLKTDK